MSLGYTSVVASNFCPSLPRRSDLCSLLPSSPLYRVQGPLHRADEPSVVVTPPPKEATAEARLGLDRATVVVGHARKPSKDKMRRKSILKQRTISDMFRTPSPSPSSASSYEDPFDHRGSASCPPGPTTYLPSILSRRQSSSSSNSEKSTRRIKFAINE
jgi:hypothetical protein